MKFDIFNIFGKDPGLPPLPRNRAIVFHMCWMAIVPAFCYMFLADAPLFFFMAVPFSLLSLAIPRSARLNARTKIYSFVGPLIVISFIDLVYKVNMDAYFMTISIISPLLIFYAISSSLLDQRPVAVLTGMSAGLGALLLQGMTISQPDMETMRVYVPKILLVGRSPDHFRFSLFILAILAQSYSILQLPKYARRLKADTRNEPLELQLKRASITVFATILLFGVATLVSVGSAKAYRVVDGITNPLYLDFKRRHLKQTLFKSKIQTDATLEWKLKTEGKRPALYISGDAPPGYLRGRAYKTYSKGVWQSEEVTDVLPSQSGKDGVSAISWHNDRESTASDQRIDVIPHHRYSPDVLYVPGNITGLEVIGDRIRSNQDGLMTVDGWDRQSGYRYFCKKVDQMVANPSPANPDPSYLDVADDVELVTFMYAKKITQNCKTDAERIATVKNHLLNNFDYSLKAVELNGEDPVINFLRSRRAGHCELFASATVMLLRSIGIKSRYVTGFACFESLPAKTHVARLRDAHAWAEAWVPEKGWVLVESTPASGIPQGEAPTGFSMYISSATNLFHNLIAGLKRGYFARVIIQSAIALWQYLKLVFFSLYSIISWPLLVLVVIALKRRLKRVKSSRVFSSHHKEFSLTRKRLILLLKRWNITYSEDMSLRDMATAAKELAIPNQREFSTLLMEYEGLRYSTSTTPDELIAFNEKFTAWMRAQRRQ